MPVIRGSAIHWHEAVVCAPAVPLLILCGVAAGDAVQGAIAAGAALSVGFGATRELRGRRWGAMLAATVGMAAAALVGSLAGRHLALLLVVAAGAAAGCAALALFDEDLWWVALQSVIALLVAGSFAGTFATALERGGIVLVGGGAQIVSILVISKLLVRWVEPADPSGPDVAPRQPLRATVLHMLRAAFCVGASMAAADALGLANGYWAPMTALIVLKPALHDTRTRGVQRLGGTIAGCGLATAYAIAVRDAPSLELSGLALMAGAAFALQKSTYAAFTGALSACIVLLISLGQTDVVANAEHRIIATLLGGAIALGVAFVFAFLGAPEVGRRAKPDRIG